MSARTEKFLTLYKNFETVVRMKGDISPKDLEENVPEEDVGRMRLCRQFRNYLSHNNDPGFLEPTDKMMKFLSEKTEELLMKEDVAKKHLKTPAASMCEENDKCMDGLAKLSKIKREQIAIKRKDGTFSACSIYAIIATITTTRPSVKFKDVKMSEKINFCKPDDLMKNLDREVLTICTSTGTPDGKVMGTVMF